MSTKLLSNQSRCYIIAEIGNNHNGNFDRAINMIDKAVDAGVDCAKFQMRDLPSVYRERSLLKKGEDLGTEYIIDLLDRFELTTDQHKKLSTYCKQKNVDYMCTPWDEKSVEILETFNVKFYKVASADLTNMPLIKKIIETKKPLILSTGMSSENEILFTRDFLKNNKADFIFLHCNSTYPAPFDDINLRWIKKLKKIHNLVGYSGHERGISVSLAAVTLGACVIERHFTLDRNMEGPDHSASLDFNDLKRLVDGTREIERALGNGKTRSISQGELINRENLAKSLVSSKAISKGTIIKASHIRVKSPGQGLSPQKIDLLIGKKIGRDLGVEDFFYESDLHKKIKSKESYDFKRPWGVPVRYHDIDAFNKSCKPDIFEFHLSYSDMDLNIEDYFKKEFNTDFAVHAPELFSESMLMDLATDDFEIRNRSIKETQRVIEITKHLKDFFPKTKRPVIIANIGGISMDATLDDKTKNKYYLNFAKSLEKLNLDGVELIPQTMAPFPWHFGGQRYQNLFLSSSEIEKWCKKLGLRMCFDISHSMLTCNHFKYDFYEFCSVVGKYSAHLHLGDALGVNGEGLQIGTGEIDFNKLVAILTETCPNASFIPEIWQGHKNNGEGFWIALDKLEKFKF